jgi:hypothetical protein
MKFTPSDGVAVTVVKAAWSEYHFRISFQILLVDISGRIWQRSHLQVCCVDQ